MTFSVLLLGSGGREHALAAALARDADVGQLHIAPGNPGTGLVGVNHRVDVGDHAAVVALAQQLDVDLVVIGPEAPLVAGLADDLRNAGFDVFGPSRQAAELEGSKAFAKEIMAAAGIPTARARLCVGEEQIAAALDEFGAPYVVKDDGLAAGKGVVVTKDREAALAHGVACGRVVVEEYLDGPEVSLFAICDGSDVLAMEPAQDFKRVGEGDTGPNTGGMGAYSPLPWAPEGLVDEVLASVIRPCLAEMSRRGTPFSGLLYTGLALTSRGVRVIEFNARFGDPETQVLLARLETPLGNVLRAAAQGTLGKLPPLRWRPGAAVTVVLAADGYPGAALPGGLISGAERVGVIQGGTARNDAGELVAAGGRVLAAVGTGADLSRARESAYAILAEIDLPGSFSRRDIAERAAANHHDSQGDHP